MKSIPRRDFIQSFLAPEGSVNFYYGRIRSGKTYAATADALELLSQGQRVVANWPIQWAGVDERTHLGKLFFSIFFNNKFYVFPRYNFLYIPREQLTADVLNELVDCHVFIDEGQWIFDSYDRANFALEKRKLIQATGHFRRTLNIIAQRTNSVQVTARAQVSRFYKCEKVLNWPWIRFKRTEFQDMAGEDVDETQPIGEKHYWASRKVYAAYNSWYLREGTNYQYPLTGKFALTTFEKAALLTSRGRRNQIAASGDLVAQQGIAELRQLTAEIEVDAVPEVQQLTYFTSRQAEQSKDLISH